MRQYVVDAFTSEVFRGNPAAVCVMDAWPSAQWMQHVAAENRLSETAFLVREAEGWRLRWFTPGTEVELCGHATLASASVVLGFYDTDADEVAFDTLGGRLRVRRDGDRLAMDFPTFELEEVPVTSAMEECFGARPVEAVMGIDLVCAFADEDAELVRTMEPDEARLLALPGRIQNVTVRGEGGVDCVSRSFCPKLAVYEDPVCGSAHCQIADYWSRRLGKADIVAYQASSRGGTLFCHLDGDHAEGGRLDGDRRITIAGETALFSIAELQVQPS